MISGREALQRLREGNRRFTDDELTRATVIDKSARGKLTAAQKPFAIILGCSDSRVPAELVFDQGLGDLFVIRVAGNIVAPSQVGSVEYAAEQFGTGLLVVLGHSKCGAVSATLSELRQPGEHRSRNLMSIVGRIQPAVQPLLDTDAPVDEEKLMQQAVRANIRASVNQLRHGSLILEQLVQSDRLLVVGAEYSLDSGEVEFFEGVPDSG